MSQWCPPWLPGLLNRTLTQWNTDINWSWWFPKITGVNLVDLGAGVTWRIIDLKVVYLLWREAGSWTLPLVWCMFECSEWSGVGHQNIIHLLIGHLRPQMRLFFISNWVFWVFPTQLIYIDLYWSSTTLHGQEFLWQAESVWLETLTGVALVLESCSRVSQSVSQ